MKIIRQVFYKLFVFALVLVSSPLFGVISLMIVLTSHFPILYQQKRIGKRGRTYILFKFRTMVKNAAQLQRYQKLNEADGPVFKIHDDPRFTRIGKFLSHTGLDELPQLFNVLKGDMSLIGPRPLPVYEAKKLKPWQRQRHAVKPGILSPWVIYGYHTNSFDDWMKSDISYTKKKSFKTDSHLFFRGMWLMGRLVLSELAKIFMH